MRIIKVFIVLSLGAILVSCEQDEVNPSVPSLTTYSASLIKVNTAYLGGRITDDGGDDVFELGVCWGPYRLPTRGGAYLNLGSGLGEFSIMVDGLEPNTTYYVRAYAENSAGVAYGNEISFRTNGIEMDVDQNIYHGITIGQQVWLQEDLKVTRYNNLDTIASTTDNQQWISTTQGAWSYYNNQNDSTFGILYNWYAIADTSGLCPEGWRVPTDKDWILLADYLGGELVAGGKLKDENLWSAPNSGPDGSTLFSAYPSGYRSFTNGDFYLQGDYGYWWTSNETNNNEAKHVTLFYNNTTIGMATISKNSGYSVRCIKNTPQ